MLYSRLAVSGKIRDAAVGLSGRFFGKIDAKQRINLMNTKTVMFGCSVLVGVNFTRLMLDTVGLELPLWPCAHIYQELAVAVFSV